MTRPSTPSLPRLVASLAFAAAVVLWPQAPADAQVGRRGLFGEAFRPDILQRDITLMTQQLQLEEWQRPVVEALMDDYATAFNTGIEALKDRMRAASESAVRAGGQGGDQVLQSVLEPLKGWRLEKDRMLEKFASDVKSQLGAQQLERWPAFERALRRERLLPEGSLSGERVDLFALLANMQPSPVEREAVAPVMDRYEVELDAALAARSQRGREIMPRLEAAMSAMDYEQMGDLQDQAMQSSVAVRDTNDAAIESIAAAMGARGPEFRRAALEQAYPDAYRIHPVMVLMQQVRRLDSLTPEQAAQVDVLTTEFAAACDAMDAKVAGVMRTEEPKAAKRRAKAMMDRKSGAASGAPGATTDDETAKVLNEKRDMGEPFRARLMAILSPEQSREVSGPSPAELEQEKLRSIGQKGGTGSPAPEVNEQPGEGGVGELGAGDLSPVQGSGAPAGDASAKGQPKKGGQREKARDPAPPAGGGAPR
jgi:hypothetical protein